MSDVIDPSSNSKDQKSEEFMKNLLDGASKVVLEQESSVLTMKGSNKSSVYLVIGEKFGSTIGVKAYVMAYASKKLLYFGMRVRVEGGEPKNAAQTFGIPSLKFRGKHSSGMVGTKVAIISTNIAAIKKKFYTANGVEKLASGFLAHLSAQEVVLKITQMDLVEWLLHSYNQLIQEPPASELLPYKLELNLPE